KTLSTLPQTESLTAVLSIKPGMLHVGNYFGALQQCIQLQNNGHQVYLCIADIQALENFTSKSDLQHSIMLTAATAMACGLDPNRSLIFQQSKVPAHSQLDWVLQCTVDEGEPDKVASHNAKLASIKEVTLGQYVAPVLTCADVLLHKPNIIPGGKDMGDLVEILQNTCLTFNKKHGDYFSPPILCISGEFSSCIRNLKEPSKKMSRSDSAKCRIDLLDSVDTVVEKCKKAVTDFTSEVYFDENNRPGVSNLIALHALASSKTYDDIQRENNGLETAQYKFVVADALSSFFTPIQNEVMRYLSEKEHLVNELEISASKVQSMSMKTLAEVYDKIGFVDKKSNSSELVKHSSFLSPPVSHEYKSGKNKHIFSGIQPTGVLHLGNYFGAVKQWVDLQSAGHDVMVCIVDQHAITVEHRRDILRSNALMMAASLIACGVDPKKSILFQQSQVSEHSQLNVLLRSVTHSALLARQAHYKDKVSTLDHSPSLGLFSYPVLQAADILLYKASHVPVGDDQKQHIQVARQVARQFNTRYGKNIFRLPEAIILDDSLARLKSLCQPTKKMSKSEVNPSSRIEILDSAEVIVDKLKCANTENYTGCIGEACENVLPAVDNFVAIHSNVSGLPVSSIKQEYMRKNIAEYKAIVADAVVEHLKPCKLKADQLLQEPGYLEEVMKLGAEKAQFRAHKTLLTIHEKIGFSL
ncbi:Tryptophan-tRNA ligase, partial [Trinorchestia longiramus]